jgi:hypothetical protein
MNEAPPKNLLQTVRNLADDERVAAGVREVYVAYGERVSAGRACGFRRLRPAPRAT